MLCFFGQRDKVFPDTTISHPDEPYVRVVVHHLQVLKKQGPDAAGDFSSAARQKNRRFQYSREYVCFSTQAEMLVKCDFRLFSPRLGVLAPRTAQRASLEKYRRPDPRSVMQ